MFSLCIFLHSPVTSSLLGPNIFLDTLFCNTFSLNFYLSVSDQVSHPFTTTGKIIVLYILIFQFVELITSGFNPLNAELNSICHLVVLLGDLTFMGPCIVSIFQYISNKMQRYTVYLYQETTLHVSGGTSTHHQERIQLYLGLSVLWVAYATHSTLNPVPTLPR
jgi:hypothetical protein